MKRTIIQIDGGHLRAVAQAGGQHYTPNFIEAFSNSLLTEDEDIIRVLYYDCAPYRGRQRLPVSREYQIFEKSDGWLGELAQRDLFAVRRGILKWRGWKPKRAVAKGIDISDNDFKPDFEQKGVDLRIGLDIATYALDNIVDRIILVTGDTDLIPAMKLARRRGVQIVGVNLPGGRISSELRVHIDFMRETSWPEPDSDGKQS